MINHLTQNKFKSITLDEWLGHHWDYHLVVQLKYIPGNELEELMWLHTTAPDIYQYKF